MELVNTTTLSTPSRVDQEDCGLHCRIVLIALYSVVLLGGTVGTIMMSRMMFKRKSQSVIATIILNIIVLRSVLDSLPLRLSYYVSDVWAFGFFTCRVVSGVIYGHMYFIFVFYVAIVIFRLLVYFKKLQVQRLQKFHAVVLSVVIWLVGSLVFLPLFFSQYGTNPSFSQEPRCFEFYKDLNRSELIVINYSVIAIMMTTVTALSLVEMVVIFQMVKALWPDMWAHQEYRAQIKSFFFLLVIFVCFVPHHAFRIYFIQNYSKKDHSQLVLYNEICVALTTVCCLDMLCFIGGLIH
ncbi:probable G-protein coupled receptor 141 [Echinops telfairi]|uniref:Probable G-protein coupled receptor 141 n=1 Tax=Echinops telfairi TaxID=9371 RepID=A0ABM1VIM6_ECHTE|nr:probable G-protein coupled receptor 141 [Echinops telfairi]